MKEIYVYKQLIGGWTGISKDEAEAKAKEGHVCGIKLEMDRGEDEPLKITLMKDSFGIFGATENELKQLADDYFNYVESITGLVSKLA